MSLIPYQQYGQQPVQGRLPFQQINPNMGFQQGEPDNLLQQRLSERNHLDVASGGRPTHQQQQQKQPTST